MSKEVILSSVFMTAVAGALQAQEVHVSATEPTEQADSTHHVIQNHVGVHGSFYYFFHRRSSATGHGNSTPSQPERPTPTPTVTKNGFGNSMRTSGHS